MLNFGRKHPVAVTIWLLIVALIGVFIYLTYTTIQTAGKIPVTINLVPSDATLTLNSQVSPPGKLYLPPGTYELDATKTGYSSFKQTIYVNELNKDAEIAVSLTPESSEAEKWAKQNQSQYLKNEGIAGKQAQVDGRKFRELNPIVQNLPYKTLLYTIGYRADTTDPTGNSIIIEIDASEGTRENVISQIERWGYDPTTLNIQFKNYTNPFAS